MLSSYFHINNTKISLSWDPPDFVCHRPAEAAGRLCGGYRYPAGIPGGINRYEDVIVYPENDCFSHLFIPACPFRAACGVRDVWQSFAIKGPVLICDRAF